MELINNKLNLNSSYRITIVRFIMMFVITVVIGFEIFAFNSIKKVITMNEEYAHGEHRHDVDQKSRKAIPEVFQEV